MSSTRAVLTGSRLPRWSPLAVLGVAAGLTGILALTTALSGVAGIVATAAILFLVLHTALSFRVEGRRQAVDRLATTALTTCLVAALVPLGLIVWKVLAEGMGVINLTFLTHSMFRVDPTPPGGGVYHAIVGTLMQALLATVIAAPIGVLAAIYLVEYGRRGIFGRLVSFFVDVMTGVPSIVAGLFVYVAWLLVLGNQKSGFAGSLALFILMLPVIIRSSEEMLRLVPDSLREAAYALGVPRWRTILKVVVPTALGGIVTGVMLGVARIMGETAPLLLLVGINQRINVNPFAFGGQQSAQETLPTFIYEQFQVAVGNPASPAFQRAWGAALTLIVLIMLLNLVARLAARAFRVK
ncbi:MAG: phosphate ABC transporter permease PstA [Actinomycetes bacterium]